MSTKMAKLVLAMGAMVMAGGAMAVQEASATANTQAVVVKPISLTNSSHLNFGRLASAAAGIVSISASGGVRTDDVLGVNLVAAKGAANEPSRATFVVAGESGLTYSISGGTGDITLASGANSIIVTLTGVWVPSKTSAAGIATEGTLPEAGETLGVGGSLPIATNTPSGTYTNTGGIALTVAYN